MPLTAATGQHIGPYEVVRYLTAGGMADLYLVRAAGGQEPLVLKCVQARYLDNERIVAMFRDEAQIGALLDHPNIVRVHEVGEADGTPYIAMEYIAGHDLVEVLRRCTARGVALRRDLAVALCAQVARGLAYAHDLRDEQGRPLEIVHCDISPGNIMLSWRGTVKLVDFGVARARIALRCQDRGVAGKHSYMAPEQILGGAVDRRADLFSLGIILYELTCGRRLFPGRPEVVMRRIVEEPIPPPRSLQPDYPADLEAIVMRALERDPAHRHPTAEALRIDLVSWLQKVPRPHGRRELARFLHSIFDPPAPAMADPVPEGNETVDLGSRPMVGRPLDDDATVETSLPAGQEDAEEGQLTRHDNPLLAPEAPPPPPLPRDPDRTERLLPTAQRRRHLSGGITTHMLGEGHTHSLQRPSPAGHPAALPEHTMSIRLRGGLVVVLATLLFLLAAMGQC
ncbi:MAG: serine/threonine-protein kinase [Myxococcales bacterium]|nr:serine/threonine protein kinase [Myxococcota bacterium]MDW8281440.1 serine/threonine-protein kinase [Myxococcales bacterium]